MTRGMDELEPREWLVYLGAWVIADGNYANFAVGERRRFALGFADLSLQDAPPGTRSAASIGNGTYAISAEVAYATQALVILDFGLLAYCDSRPPPAITGSWRAGSVFLEVDCYSYFEIHAKVSGVPPAVYAWTITGIWRQTAPFIPDPSASRSNVYVRDPERLGYMPLDRTDAWEDDDGSAEYLLRCRLEADPPTFHP